MNDFLLIVLIVLFLIVVGIFLFVMSIILKVKRSVGSSKINELASVISASKEIAREEKRREKSVVGMTNLVLPQVIQDIPDFNVNILIQKFF